MPPNKAVRHGHAGRRARLEPLDRRTLLAVHLLGDLSPHVTASSAPFDFMPVGTDAAFALASPSAFGYSASLWGLRADGTHTVFATSVATGNATEPPVGQPSVAGDRVIFETGDLKNVAVADFSTGNVTKLLSTDDTSQAAINFTPYRDGWLFSLTVPANGANRPNSAGLYYTDGTAAGTLRLLSTPIGGFCVASDGRPIIAAAQSGVSQLWTTDGTTTGTAPLATLPAGAAGANDFISVGGKTFFVGSYAKSVWTTDGTTDGTVQIWAAPSGTTLIPPNVGDYTSYLFSAGQTVFFSDKTTLYRTRGVAGDATAIGTGVNSVSRAVESGDCVYLFGGTSTLRRVKADGTITSGSTLNTSFGSGFGDGIGNLYFTNGSVLTRTDATATGTVIVRDVRAINGTIGPGGTFGGSAGIGPFGEDLATYANLYTQISAVDYVPGTFVGDHLWAGLPDASLGFEPFYGKPNSLSLVADLTTTTSPLSNSNPSQFTSSGDGDVFFKASAGPNSALWRLSNGSVTRLSIESGAIQSVDASSVLLNRGTGGAMLLDRQTLQLTNLGLGAVSSRNILALADGSYLAGVTNSSNYPIVRTAPGQSSQLLTYYNSNRALFRLVGPNVVFEVGGRLLYLSLIVNDVPVDLAPSADLANAVTAGNQLYFVGGGALRVTDGSVAGTQALVDGTAVAGGAAGAFVEVTRAGSSFFLLTQDRRLFVSDGTAAGTHPVGSVHVDASATPPVAIGDRLLFRENGQLWAASADGSAVMLSDVVLANASSTQNNGIAVVDATHAFALGNLPDGRTAIVRTDGSVAGTSIDSILNIAPGTPSTSTAQISAAGGHAFLSYNDPAVGIEPFEITSADDLAPFVRDASFDVASHSVNVRMSESIAASSLSADDLIASNLTTGQTFTPTAVTQLPDHTLRFTLPTNMSDGNYRFDLAAGAVSDVAGLASTAAFTFSNADTFVLAGDANRDRAVNFSDLLILAKHYGQSGATFADGDFDASGTVDFADLLILAKRYGGSLATPSLAPLASASTAARRRASAAVDVIE